MRPGNCILDERRDGCSPIWVISEALYLYKGFEV